MIEPCSEYLSVWCNWLYSLIIIISEWIYTLPSKHLLLLKTSSKRQQPNSFSSSKMFWRRLEVVLKTSCKYVLKTSWKTKNCYAEDVLKTCLEDVSKICLEDVLETNKMFTGNIFSNKSKSVSDKSISHISISDKWRRIQYALITTQ